MSASSDLALARNDGRWYSATVTQDDPTCRLFAADTAWIEGEALRQLEAASRLPGMKRVVGLPDLHPGKGGPVGAAFLADRLYPMLVGNDIGCGMALWTTDLPVRKAKAEKLAFRLDGLDRPEKGEADSLGTIGRGNHFLEIQQVHDIADPQAFAALGIDADHLCVLVHTGSRGLGEAILRHHTERFGATAIAADSPEGEAYLADHARAMRFAAANRAASAGRALEAIGAEGAPRLDSCHNSVTPMAGFWLHRKGAAPGGEGPVVIPGSRGDLTFIVDSACDREDALWSIAHGAGRKLARHEAKGKLEKRYRRDDLRRNPWGGQVVCGDDALLWEEAPGAYKDVSAVIGDLVTAKLVRVIATLKPLVTFKTSARGTRERR